MESLVRKESLGDRFFYARWMPWGLAVAGGVFLARSNVLESVNIQTAFSTYQTLATLSGTLLGLSMTTTSLLLNAFDKPLPGFTDGFPAARQRRVLELLYSLMRALGIACALSLAAIISAAAQWNWWLKPYVLLIPVSVVAAVRLYAVLRFTTSLFLARA